MTYSQRAEVSNGEKLFRRAVVDVLEDHQELTQATWRQIAADLEVHESLLSHAKKLERSASADLLVKLDGYIPLFWEKLVRRLRQLQREQQ